MPSHHVVDLHTHVFNARYLPLEGILRDRHVPGWLAGLTRRLLNLLTGKADFVDAPHRARVDGVGEEDNLAPLAEMLAAAAAGEMAERVVNSDLISIKGERAVRAAMVEAALRTDDLYLVLEDIEEAAWGAQRANVRRHQVDEVGILVSQLEGARAGTDADNVELVRGWFFNRFRKALLWLLEQLKFSIVADAFGTALDYIKFLLLMLSKESTLRDALFAGYEEGQNLKLCVHLMMDMQKAYSDEPPPTTRFTNNRSNAWPTWLTRVVAS